MDFEIGIVCGRCDSYSAMGTATCASCGNPLALYTRSEPTTDPALAPSPASGAGAVVDTKITDPEPPPMPQGEVVEVSQVELPVMDVPVVAKSAYTEPPPSLL